jgi:aminoglycoside 3-N-acetyltransferase
LSAPDRFLALDGKIVLLGSDHDTVTFLHYVEHVADILGKRIARYQVPVMEDGRRYGEPRRSSIPPLTGFTRIGRIVFSRRLSTLFLRTAETTVPKVGNTAAYILSARELFNFALAIMIAVAANPSAAKSLTERSIHR